MNIKEMKINKKKAVAIMCSIIIIIIALLIMISLPDFNKPDLNLDETDINTYREGLFITSYEAYDETCFTLEHIDGPFIGQQFSYSLTQETTFNFDTLTIGEWYSFGMYTTVFHYPARHTNILVSVRDVNNTLIWKM